MTAAVIYARISADDGTARGVARQEADCRALCETRGWTVAEVIVDNDQSAFSGKRRPGYETLLDGLRARRWDALVVWHPDRLHRRPIELEEFIDVVETSGVQVSTVTAGEIDLATPDGRLMARIVGSVARKESEDKSRRIRRKHLELAEQGLSSGGMRPFGFEADRVTLRPSEAQEIRDAVDRILAGASLRSIMWDWRERIPTVTGGEWSRGTIQRILCSPRIAGLREHRGQVVGPAKWPAIIDPDELLRVQACFGQGPKGVVARSYLLTGWVVCGLCGDVMTTRPSRGNRRYVCSRDRGGCGGCGISAPPVEDLVGVAVVEHLTRKGTLPAVTQPDLSALPGIEARLVELAEMWAAGEIGRPEWTAARQSLEARRDAVVDAVPAASYTGRDVQADWAAGGVEARRAIVASALDRVVIAGTDKRAGRFDERRIGIKWL